MTPYPTPYVRPLPAAQNSSVYIQYAPQEPATMPSPRRLSEEERQREIQLWWEKTCAAIFDITSVERGIESAFVRIHHVYAKIEHKGWTPKTPKKLYKVYKEALERSVEEAQYYSLFGR